MLNRSFFARLGRQIGGRAVGIRSGVLTLGALGSLTYAAFGVDYRLGWVAVAISLLALDWYWSADNTGR